MKTEIHINVNDALLIAHKVLQYLSAYALELLIEAAQKELKARIDFEGK